jgi:hypothetical protein
MDDTTILGGVLNQLGQTAKQTVKQVVKLPEEMAADLGNQIGGTSRRPGSEEQVKTATSNESKQWQSDEERVKFLKDLYGVSEGDSSGKENASEKKQEVEKTSANPLVKSEENKRLSEFQEEIADKSPEEQKKLMELRNQLHKDFYYDPTFNQKNPPAGEEERPAEKIELEKKQEMMDLQKKEEKKPPPLAVVREQNKAEQFRGAAG